MLERIFKRHEHAPRERTLAAGEPPECSHLMLRPRWDAGGYVCQGCLQPFTVEEAEQLCSDAPLRASPAGA